MRRIIILSVMLAACLAASAQANVATTTAGEQDETVYTLVDQEPVFPGGIEAMYQYIAANVHYPDKAKEQKITGKVIVQFAIEKDGTVSNIKMLHCPDESLCAEAERVVKAMPRWKPGSVKGKKVRVQYTLPINFSLNNQQ